LKQNPHFDILISTTRNKPAVIRLGGKMDSREAHYYEAVEAGRGPPAI
jgi:hypothetical protein